MNLESAAHAIGKDGFNWWIGQVENDGSDPENNGEESLDYDYTGKVKVRIVGYHNPDKEVLPTRDLPWASCIMPAVYAMKSGMGSIQQLQVSSWVVGFFMDGSSAQIPIIMGSISDQNPNDIYTKLPEESSKAYQQIHAPDYDPDKHGTGGGIVGGTADTTSTDSSTGNTSGPVQQETTEEDTVSTVNPRGDAQQQTEAMKKADERKKYTIHVGNGKCGTPADVKIKGATAEFLKFARGIEKNDIGEFINKTTGKIEDVAGEIEAIQDRIQGFMGGVLANVKGTVLKETQKHIQEVINDIKIPDPDLLDPAVDQLKNIGDLVDCLFKQLFNELADVIGGLLNDLIGQALDAALCLAQDIFSDLFGGLMDKLMKGLDTALGILDGALSAIKNNAALIQQITNKVLDLIDMVCEGDLSCALGLSTFETGAGGKESEGDKQMKQMSQYSDAAKSALKDGKTQLVGTAIPNSRGWVPVTKLIGGQLVKKAFNTKNGEFAEVGAAGTGVTSKTFEKGKSLIEKFDSVYPIRASDGTINFDTLNCSPSNTRKKPCFPELIFDNAQSTSLIRALPIIDDIGAMVGVLMRNKGSNINTTAKVRAMFTCNEPEGVGADLTPIIKNGKIEKVRVNKPGVGYGLDPDNTYCPREQRFFLVDKVELNDYADTGDVLFYQESDGDPNTAILQVIEYDYDNTGLVALATLEKTDMIPPGLKVQTLGGSFKFQLNPLKEFYDLAIPANATALYANCDDILPVLDTIDITNVGKGYKNPKIYVGPNEIGDISTDTQGRLLTPTISTKTLGFVRPRIVDPEGYGANIVPTYQYVGPTKFNEIFESQSYIDCVGHPPNTTIQVEETAQVSGVSDPSGGTTTIASGITETPDTPVTVDPPTENTTPPQQNDPPSSGGGGGGNYGGGY
tara:strand:- start:1243 stop:3966 length:2724 start_codon:yes stop_codon:yes gene_type:complete